MRMPVNYLWAYSPDRGGSEGLSKWSMQIAPNANSDRLFGLELDFFIYCEDFGHKYAETITDIICNDASQTAAYVFLKTQSMGAKLDVQDYQSIYLTIMQIRKELRYND